MADGSKAVGIFNRHPKTMMAEMDVEKLGLGKTVKARDIWLGKDLGKIDGSYRTTIPGHGVLLLHVSR